MEGIIRIVGIGIAMAVVIGILRSTHTPMAVQLSISFTVVMMLVLIEPLREVLTFFAEMGRRAGMNRHHLEVLFKAVGIAYVASVGAQLAKDAGEQSVAVLIELGGKVLILTVAIPVFSSILLSLLRLLP